MLLFIFTFSFLVCGFLLCALFSLHFFEILFAVLSYFQWTGATKVVLTVWRSSSLHFYCILFIVAKPLHFN